MMRATTAVGRNFPSDRFQAEIVLFQKHGSIEAPGAAVGCACFCRTPDTVPNKMRCGVCVFPRGQFYKPVSLKGKL